MAFMLKTKNDHEACLQCAVIVESLIEDDVYISVSIQGDHKRRETQKQCQKWQQLQLLIPIYG